MKGQGGTVLEYGALRSRSVVVTAVALSFAVVAQPLASALAALVDSTADVYVSKTVTSASVTPTLALSLNFGPGQDNAIPGDHITYTSTLSNIGATIGVGGQIIQGNNAAPQATLAAYYDVVSTRAPRGGKCSDDDGSGSDWRPFAGQAAHDPAWTVIEIPPITTGLTLTATGVPARGVTYPSSGDPFVGTVVATDATARWSYQASLNLAPAQVMFLLDPSLVCAIRNSFHIEVSPRNHPLQPSTYDTDFSTRLLIPGRSGNVTNASITINPPTGASTTFNSSTNPTLAAIAPGGSVTVTLPYTVPAIAPRGATESEFDYLPRLMLENGRLLQASASGAGTGWGGPVSVAATPVSTTQHVPVVTIAKTGPATVDGGTTAQYPLALTNVGSAPASVLEVTDSVPGGASGTVTGVPPTLTAAGQPGSTATASATFPVPASQPEGPLTDTASIRWQDANHNAYGSLSSAFTTQVHNILFGATLTLAPISAGPNVPGTSQTLVATLLDRNGNPIPSQSVTFNITGVNPVSGTAITDANGKAVFNYIGTNAGNDVAQATVSSPGITLPSNTSNISWGKPLQAVVTTPALGNFFANPSNSCTFDVGSSSKPVFGQTFPDILFNPPTSAVPHNISGVDTTTRPFTDLTVDVNGNYNGKIVAQGNGLHAGVGSLTNFYAEFTGSFIVGKPGDLTFTILHDDGYILGVGNGASRVNGDLLNDPPTMPFNPSYAVIAASNGAATGVQGTATVHFPAAGIYPYELDYSECTGGTGLSLVLLIAQFVAQTDPLSIYVGYADGLRFGAAFPFPWQGSPNVTFVGGCTFDAGALRFDNSGDTDITFDSVTVDLGSPPGAPHFDLWGPLPLVVPAHKILILTQTGCFNFDTSDFSSAGCRGNNGVLPLVNVTRSGVTKTYTDTNQILNTHGFDTACLGNESIPWERIAGSASTINVPLPPAATLNLSPFSIPGAVQGQSVTLTASAMDGAGNPAVNLPVAVQVAGANPQTLNGTTGPTGLATFTYVGLAIGTDSAQASAFVLGLRAVSNIATIVWTAPGAAGSPLAPSITNPSPADGTIVTKPIAVNATIAPPAGHSITSWRVFYQAASGGRQVVIKSGTGTPPSPLGVTFDPTVLANGVYTLTIEVTADSGATQAVSSGISVFGGLKLGRYTTTFKDLSVPVNGFPMEIRRTYDSLDKSSGDFGVGWRVSVSNFRVAPNRILGAGGWTQYNKSCVLGLCFTAFKNSAPRFVSVTFPDQHTEIFDFTPQGGTNIFWACSPQFTARAETGTTSTLQALDDTNCSYTGDGNIYGDSGPYSPNRFQLTTHDGRVLVLDRTLGLISKTNRNGNSLTVDATGVHSSSGGSITFTRDAGGRITNVTGPSGQTLTYTYGASNDLASVTDANGNVETFAYDSAHDLLSAKGSLGPLQTIKYDASGRLVSYTDGAGNVTTVSNDVAAQKQVVIDATGALTTVYTMDDLGDVVRTDRTFGRQTLTSTATFDAVGRPLSRTDPLGHTITATYDSSGNFISFTDKTGARQSGTYDAFGGVTAVTDQLGNTTHIQYDSKGNLSTLTNSLGQATQFVHDSKGNKTQRTDALGQVWTYEYDAAGNQTLQTDPLGKTTVFVYDASGRMTSESNALGAANNFTYDPNGNLISVTDGLGKVTKYAYDALDRTISQTDAAGNKTTYLFDGAGSLLATTDALGNHTTSTYDADGRPITTTDALGRTTTYAYDGAGRLVSETLPNAARLTFTYDAGSRKASSTDALGNTTTYAYDAAGRLLSTTDPLGHVTRQVYDAKGRLVQAINALGQITRYTYDSEDESLTVTDPTGAVVTDTYDAGGRLLTTTDPVGHTTTFAYDAVGREIGTTDPLGRTNTFAYDALGELISQKVPSGSVTFYAYDADGRRVSVTDAVGGITRYTYDALGRTVGMTDARGNATAYAYDAVGHQVSATDALGGVARTVFDAAGQTLSTTNPRGDTVRFTYNTLGEPASRTDPFGAVTTYTYDAAGRRISMTDPRGVHVTYSYDAAGNQISIGTPDGPITSVYDAVGRRTSMTDTTGQTLYAYDAAGRIISVGSPEGAVTYGYDAAGRRTSLTLPSSRTVTYGYDAASQMTSLVDWFGLTTLIAYNADGNRTALSRPNGVTTSYAYDGAGRLVGVNNDGPGGPIQHFSYALDANGNRTAVTSSTGTESYVLDALHRITHVTYPNGDSVGYAYDAAGNRTSANVNGTTTNYTYDPGGRLAAVGATSLTYDAAGNATSVGVDTFSYDWADRLVASTTGGVATTYKYDGSDVRVGITSGASTSGYLWDRTSSVALLLDDGSHGFVQAGGLLEQLTSGGSAATLWPTPDALGSTRGVTNSFGAVVGTASYDVFGGSRSQTGTGVALGFASEQTDPATGFVYLRARYLNPVFGRFITPDSVQPNSPGTQGHNLYSYTANNPVTVLDPSGHQSFTETATIRSGEAAATEALTAEASQAAADAAGAEAEAAFAASRCLVFGIVCQRIVDLLTILLGAYAIRNGLCATATCAPAGGTTTEPHPAPTPGGTTLPAPQPEPWLPPTKVKNPPRAGQIVYRVYDSPRGRWNGESWTPENPTLYGSQKYRVVAGLPDRETTGNCLVTGVLMFPAGVTPRASLPMSPPRSYRKYPGGLPEYVIFDARTQVLFPTVIKLDPPYGNDPDNPPRYTAACTLN